MIKLVEDTSKRFESFWDLRNADDLFDEIIEKLKQFDKDLNPYNTDVYLYVDEDMNGELYDFINVGGNSWLNDDHYTLWTDKQRYEDWTNYWQSVGEIADALDMLVDDLKQETLDYLNNDLDEDDWNYIDDIDDIDYDEIYRYIRDERPDYLDRLEKIRCGAIDNDFNSEYRDSAKEIVRKFDSDLNYSEDY